MGSVWRAEHLDLGTPLAVKLIDEMCAQSPEALARFRREAQAAASLRGANVVQILDYGIDGETPYIAMELLVGESLAERLDRQVRLDPVECATILLQVSKALGRAHELGIVHRDLKPDNVYLVREGDDEIAKVLDFGIAKRTTTLEASADVATRTGSLMGTPYYMSPEQASGRRQIDSRTDTWAFAVIAYECLTGQKPFSDDNLGGLLLAICTEAPPAPSSVCSVPEGFDEWFARCTAKDPDARYESIRDAAVDLCVLCGIQVPLGRASYSGNFAHGAPQHNLVQSVTPWRSGQTRRDEMTPGGVERRALLQNGRTPTILASNSLSGSRRWLIAGGSVVFGLLGAVTYFAMRVPIAGELEPSRNAVALQAATRTVEAVAASPSSSIAAPPAASSPPLAASTTAAPSASSVPAIVGKGQPAPRTKPRGSRNPVQAQPSTAPAVEVEPRRLQARDRLERDLGF